MTDEAITQETESTAKSTPAVNSEAKLQALLTFKIGMTQYIDDKGEMIPCTVLKYEPMTISQIKTQATDGYTAVQVACKPKKKSRARNGESQHFGKTGNATGVYHSREFRCDVTDMTAGSIVSINSLVKGDIVKATAVSKGKGFQGAVKRWNAGGGPGAHGSTFHRQPGSSGNRTWPGRVMKGKHFPGHLGDESTSVRNLKVLDVINDDSLIIVNGAVPGGKNALVTLFKKN